MSHHKAPKIHMRDGRLNILQRYFEQNVSSQKSLYAQKKPKPNNDVLIDFHLKNYSLSY